MARTAKASLSHLAVPGAELVVRVTPRARRETIEAGDDGALRVQVTAPPEDGKATAAVTALLARALGVPQGALVLVRGVSARTKTYRIASD